ncbi:hypothetical protein [Raoultibacter phocaeensis]|uniref:hypothetical protein n=1 Tax=Raoultibacter phocaeensis TaxID=2479841 RepID=UPI0015D655B3|nr:hypothetical protein [Raoultibacter phocaeensis]
MDTFAAVFNLDYFNFLLGMLPTLVFAGMLLPFAPWACGMVWLVFRKIVQGR